MSFPRTTGRDPLPSGLWATSTEALAILNNRRAGNGCLVTAFVGETPSPTLLAKSISHLAVSASPLHVSPGLPLHFTSAPPLAPSGKTLGVPSYQRALRVITLENFALPEQLNSELWLLVSLS